MNTQIVDFYLGGKDSKNRSIQEIISWSDSQIEAVHDFIQWIFPLHERSLHSVGTPFLTAEDIEFLSNSQEAKDNMLLCLERFKDFLGVDGDEKKHKRWARTGDHNLLRITRVIRSLRLFGLEDEAKDFHTKVSKIAKSFDVTKVTMQFWDKALKDTLSDSMTAKFLKMKEIRL